MTVDLEALALPAAFEGPVGKHAGGGSAAPSANVSPVKGRRSRAGSHASAAGMGVISGGHSLALDLGLAAASAALAAFGNPAAEAALDAAPAVAPVPAPAGDAASSGSADAAAVAAAASVTPKLGPVPAPAGPAAAPLAAPAPAPAGPEDDKKWMARITAILKAEAADAAAAAAAAAAASGAPAPAKEKASGGVKPPAKAAAFPARLWDAVADRLARRTVYLAIFLYGETRDRLRAGAAAKARPLEASFCDHVTVKVQPVRGDFSRELLDCVGLPVHLVAHRLYASGKRGAQAATVAWPDFVVPEGDEAAAAMTAAAGDASADGGAGAAPSKPLTPAAAAAIAAAAAAASAAAAAAAAGAPKRKGPENVRLRGALAAIDGAHCLSARAHPHVVVSLRHGTHPGVVDDMIAAEDERQRRNAAEAGAGADAAVVGVEGSEQPAGAGSERRRRSSTVGSAAGAFIAVGASGFGSAASGAGVAGGVELGPPALDLFGRLGFVVVDGADFRHRTYLTSREALWGYLFGPSGKAVVEAAAAAATAAAAAAAPAASSAPAAAAAPAATVTA